MWHRFWSIRFIAVCIAVFIIQLAVSSFTDMFALISENVLFAPWTLVTSMFLHGSVEHLLYNMFALGLFGFILETIVGSRRFLVIFFAGGMFASIGAAIFYPAAIGASGAIFSVLGALTVLRPRMVVWVGGAPMPMFVAAIVWASIDLIGMFSPGQTANAAHLFGLGFGLAYAVVRLRQFREKKKPKDAYHVDKREIDEWERKWM